jgi:hypothetical protein
MNFGKIVSRYVCAIILFQLSFSAADSAPADKWHSCPDAKKKIELFIRDIEIQSDLDTRVGESLKLAFYVRDNSTCAQSSRLIHKLVALLGDDDDGVRMGAAMALGYIGPAASSAVPALKSAIAHSDALLETGPSPFGLPFNTVLPANTSGDAARTAIFYITRERVPAFQGYVKSEHK